MMSKRWVVVGLVAVVAACGAESESGGAALPSDVGAPVAQPVDSGGAITTAGVGALPPPSTPAPTGTGSDPIAPLPDPTLPPVDPALPAEAGCRVALDECGMDTGWPGDELCILPPPPDMGFQVHVGPSSYDNPEPQYVLQPGQETDTHFDAVSGNTTDIRYYWRQYRMRAGSHHLIVSKRNAFAGGRLGGSSVSAKDNPECGIIAPENETVGIPLGPNTPLDVNLHYFNVTGTTPVLQETWINFWYRDPAVATEETREMFAMGGLAMAIPAGAHTVLGRYSCPVTEPGRVLTMYGHFHAQTVRFSAWRVRNGQEQLIIEDYDWHDPLALEFSSIVENTAPDPSVLAPGGHNGILDLQPGDALEWECEVNNQSGGTLRFTNEAVTGEMCILIGDTLGPSISCQFP